MNLPFTPTGAPKSAPVALVEGITDAGHSTDDVQVVADKPKYWQVFFNSTTDTLIVNKPLS